MGCRGEGEGRAWDGFKNPFLLSDSIAWMREGIATITTASTTTVHTTYSVRHLNWG